MNTELLQKIKQKIIENPKDLEMGVWVCDSQACIAGWAGKLSGVPFPDSTYQHLVLAEADFEQEFKISAKMKGAELLDLTEEQASRLFLLQNWPDTDRIAYNNSESPQCKVRATCARIDRFISTDGQE
jgi:hypothetical protein